MVLLFLVYGMASGAAAGLVEIVASLLLVPGFVMFLVGVPVVEESARITTLRMIADTPGPRRDDQYRWPVMAFALGFAGIEKLFHWIGLGFSPLAVNALEVLFVTSPFLMHVAATFIATVLIIAGKVKTAFAVCILFHGIHNVWNTLMVSFSDTTLWIILPIQDALLALATVWLFSRWRAAAPEMQLRTSPVEVA